jgi:FlaA1/EpsC-like NDP-sugar epimerase
MGRNSTELLSSFRQLSIRGWKNSTVIVCHDIVMAAVAWLAAWLVRFNLDIPYFNWQLSLYILPLVLLIQVLVFYRFRLYRGLWRFASLPDLWNIFRAAIVAALSITVVLFIWFRLEGIPRSVLVLYPVFLIFFLGGPRLGYRIWKDRSLNLNYTGEIKRVLIVGAGRAGEMLVREMLREPGYNPVGFIDDNLSLRSTEVHGVRVVGTVPELPQISEQGNIDLIVIAAPSATNEQMQRIIDQVEQTGIPMRTLPRLREMVSGRPVLGAIREISIEDLLGRQKIELDWPSIRHGIANKVIMVSGGGGSIGSELCLQIARANPAALIIFERSEFNLYRIQRALADLAPRFDVHPVLGDVCDKARVEQTLARFRPEVIFHAAAYKQVPLLQHQVREAVRNNVFGTRNLADAAGNYECGKFVFISTDKAVNPGNVLGATKRVGEMYCEYMNQHSDTCFVTVRFGNVLDSDGSVVPLFREQIRKGGPITVTHPEITRFFMTISEACQLILQAGAMAEGGEIYVLDMGTPVRISYLAEQMIILSGKTPGQDIRISYIGLRPGEKLAEELFYAHETRDKTTHPNILQARHGKTDFSFIVVQMEALEQACNDFADDKLTFLLDRIVSGIENTGMQNDNISYMAMHKLT